MQVGDSRETLAEELEGLGLAHVSVLVLVAEKSAVLCQFHYHVDRVFLDQRVPQLDYVRVVYCRVQVYLPLQEEQLVLGYSV